MSLRLLGSYFTFLFCLSTSTDAAPDQKQACAILRTLESLLAVRHRFAVLLPARPSGACCSQLPLAPFRFPLVVSRHGLALARGLGDVPGGSPSLLAGRLRLSLPCAGLCVASASAVCEASLLAAWSFSWTTSCEDNWLYCTRREAQAVDAVFYLRHLIQLRLLRTGRLGPVAWLIAPWLPLGFCSCLFASWSVLCLALEGFLSRRSAGRDAVADLRPHTAPSYASQSRPASPSQPAAPRAPRLLGGGLRSDVALLDVCRLQRTADVSLAEGAGRPLRKRGAARPPGGGLAPRRLPPK